MHYSARDIQQLTFKTCFRGLNAKAVNKALGKISADYAQMAKERDALREQAQALSETVADYRHIEESIKNALLSAQRTADETLSEARSEADEMMADAGLQADRAVADAFAEADKTIADAESHAQKTLRDASEQADSMVSAARAKAASTIASAEDTGRRAVRAAKEEAAEILRRHDGAKREFRQFRKRFESLLFEQFEVLKRDAIAHGELSSRAGAAESTIETAAAESSIEAVAADSVDSVDGADGVDGVDGVDSAGRAGRDGHGARGGADGGATSESGMAEAVDMLLADDGGSPKGDGSDESGQKSDARRA